MTIREICDRYFRGLTVVTTAVWGGYWACLSYIQTNSPTAPNSATERTVLWLYQSHTYFVRAQEMRLIQLWLDACFATWLAGLLSGIVYWLAWREGPNIHGWPMRLLIAVLVLGFFSGITMLALRH